MCLDQSQGDMAPNPLLGSGRTEIETRGGTAARRMDNPGGPLDRRSQTPCAGARTLPHHSKFLRRLSVYHQQSNP